MNVKKPGMGLMVCGLMALSVGCGIVDAAGSSESLDSESRALVDPDPGFFLMRYTQAGVLDTTFSGDGLVTATHYGVGWPKITLDGSGRILAVSGGIRVGVNEEFALARYNSNGSFDTTFGGDGVVYTDFAQTERDFAMDVVVQADGRIVVVGAGTNGSLTAASWYVARYLTGGALDTSFGTNGRVTTDFGTAAWPRSVVLDGTGKIIVAGNTGTAGGSAEWGRLALARYNANGTLDTTFNGTGKVVTDVPATDKERVESVKIGPSGRIVVGGGGTAGQAWLAVVARYNTNGSLDTTFGGTGYIAVNPLPSTVPFGMYATDMFVDSSSRIVVGGSTAESPGLRFEAVRFTSSGTLDTSFSGDGVQITAQPQGAQDGRGMALTPGGKIVIGGNNWYQPPGQQMIYGVGAVRYNTDGSLDTSFSGDGRVQSVGTLVDTNIWDAIVDSSGRVIMVGNWLGE